MVNNQNFLNDNDIMIYNDKKSTRCTRFSGFMMVTLWKEVPAARSPIFQSSHVHDKFVQVINIIIAIAVAVLCFSTITTNWSLKRNFFRLYLDTVWCFKGSVASRSKDFYNLGFQRKMAEFVKSFCHFQNCASQYSFVLISMFGKHFNLIWRQLSKEVGNFELEILPSFSISILDQTGNYTCVASNSEGDAVSEPLLLKVAITITISKSGSHWHKVYPFNI